MANPFKFGTPTTTSGASGTPTTSLFGQNTTGSSGGGGIFGNVGSAQTAPGGSKPLFSTAASGQPSSLFGQATSTTPSFSLKPADSSSTPSPFGAAPNKAADPATSGAPKAGSLFGDFGKPKVTSSPFGSATPAPTGGALFGNISTTPAGPPPASSAGKAPSLFSQPSQSTTAPASLFGAKPTPTTTAASTAPATAPGSTLFGGAATKGPSTAMFGSGTPFGQAPGDKEAVNTQAPKADPKPNLFGGPAATPSTAPQSGGSLFGTPTTTTVEKPAQNLFGSTPSGALTTTRPATAGNLFGQAAPKTSSANETIAAPAATTAPQAPTPSLFSAPKLPDATSAAPKPGAPAAAAAAPATSIPLTTTAPITAAAGAIVAPSTGVAATASTTALGASTAGPVPLAQSRLKNKTMDEIITRWATDLTKYQKEFQEQAEQVVEWDRMLVENSSKVQKLYGNTVDAERATQEVERQLAAVEGQQEELGSWLDRYEQEVETLLSKQVGVGDSLQGPDQERERTYKLAERLSERLNDMGQDLSSMIEEVNSASANLSKTTKSDEPISQIVRILNSHLSQLQLIDQGTAALRAKISSTQQSGSSLSGLQSQYGGTPGSVSGGAAEDFYRVYMGRRR
ncbi:FG-nucleoporin nsp1 [Ophidiomyces ophidiicola]|nr:FG-nucleoporin nsp1 [Ophidiomyces ophidiicola]